MRKAQRIVSIARLGMLGLALLTGCAAPRVAVDSPWGDAYPTRTLANQHLALLVMEPNTRDALNRGDRFERAGVVLLAKTADGHTLFGPIVEPAAHDPTRHDHIAGLAEEFDLDGPASYELTKPGAGFVKIGVGVLERPDGEPYRFHRDYVTLDAGRWVVTQTADAMRFTHELDGLHGIAYTYTKTLRLHPDAPGFTLERELTNRGLSVIDTEHYGHHFLMINGVPAGPGYRLDLPQPVRAGEAWKDRGYAGFQGGDLVWRNPVTADRALWGELAGWPADAPVAMTLWHDPEGVGLRIEHDHPIERLVVYSLRPVICPELFTRLVIEPGETKRWSTDYRVVHGR